MGLNSWSSYFNTFIFKLFNWTFLWLSPPRSNCRIHRVKKKMYFRKGILEATSPWCCEFTPNWSLIISLSTLSFCTSPHDRRYITQSVGPSYFFPWTLWSLSKSRVKGNVTMRYNTKLCPCSVVTFRFQIFVKRKKERMIE